MLYAMNFKSWSLRVSVINNKVCARLSSVRCEWGSVSSNVALTHQLSVLFRIATWVWRRQTKRSVMTKSSSLFLLTLYPPTPSPPRCLVPWCECVCVRVRACARARMYVVCAWLFRHLLIFFVFSLITWQSWSSNDTSESHVDLKGHSLRTRKLLFLARVHSAWPIKLAHLVTVRNTGCCCSFKLFY